VPTSLSAQKRRGYCGSTICGCLVIVHHSVEPYASATTMYTRLPDPPVPGLWAFLEVNAAFGMGIWFLLGGIFTPGSVDRRGLAGFLRDRAVRLGIPLIFAFLLLIPFEGWFYHLAYEPWPAVGYWDYFVHDFLGFGGRPPNWPESRWPDANFGHFWFVEHLLLYSFCYGIWRMVAPEHRNSTQLPPPNHLTIALYAIGLAVATYAVRHWYPQDRWIAFLGFVQMEPAHLPQYISLFAIGILAGRNDWLASMPTDRALPWLVLGIVLGLGCYLLVGSGIINHMNSQSLVVCVWEAPLCTAMCVGVPVVFRELASRQNSLIHMLSADSYAAYVSHFPIVMIVQWLLIGTALPVAARILVTILGSILLTFLMSEYVVLRIPGIRRILGS
jgi:glucans biosynthesis protein C